MIARLVGLSRAESSGGRASCSTGSSCPRPAAGPPRPTPAACGAGSTWRPAWSNRRRSSTWTSPPPGWTRGPATQVWDTVRGLVARRRDRAAHHAVPGRGRRARRPDRGLRPRPGGGRRAPPRSSRRRSAAQTSTYGRWTGPVRRRWPRSSPGVTGARPEVRPRHRAGHRPAGRPRRAAGAWCAARRARASCATELALRLPSLDEVFLSLTGHHAESGREHENDHDRTRARRREPAA